MSCSSPITCELQRIADTLEQSRLNEFLTTFTATLLGAGIAAFVAWLVFRGEQGERYRTGLVDAAEALSVAMTRTAEEYEEFIREVFRPVRPGEHKGSIRQPDGTNLDIGLEMLIARTRGEDRVTAKQIREVAYQLRFIENPQWARAEYATLRRVVIEWASTSVSNKDTRRNLAIINERRIMKAENPKIEDSELPPAPTRYEAVEVG